MGSKCKFEIKKNSNQWHFTLIADSQKAILSSEHYKSKSACEKGIQSVKKNAGQLSHYKKRASRKGQPYFVLLAGNNKVIGNSQMYKSESARDADITEVKREAMFAPIVDTSTRRKRSHIHTRNKKEANTAPLTRYLGGFPAF